MKEKKTLNGWQFGVLAGLLVLMFSTMFMPILQANGKVYKKVWNDIISGLEKMAEKSDDSELKKEIEEMLDEYDEKNFEKTVEEIDEELKEAEKTIGFKVSSITPLRIMTLRVPGSGIVKLIFILAYFNTILMLGLTIACFAAKWSKKPVLILDLIYSILSSIILGFIRFGLVRMVVNSYGDLVSRYTGVLSQNIDVNAIEKIFIKSLSRFFGFGLIVAFAASVLLVVFSIVCLSVGGNTRVSTGWEGGMGYTPVDPDPVNAFDDNPFGGNGYNDAPQPANFTNTPAPKPVDPQPFYTPPVQQVTPPPAEPVFQAPPVQPAKPAAEGKVRCTRGAAVGQGFRLPVDRKVIVGKSPTRANLVIPDDKVSNIHCSIRYNAVRNTYIVKDHSTNGTFVNGVRLPQDIPMEYPAGTVLSLADGANEITLG